VVQGQAIFSEPKEKKRLLIAPFDVFLLEENGPVWRGYAESLDSAKATVATLSAGKYMIVSLKTGNRIVVSVNEAGVVTENPQDRH
jgi:hypothetical protein